MNNFLLWNLNENASEQHANRLASTVVPKSHTLALNNAPNAYVIFARSDDSDTILDKLRTRLNDCNLKEETYLTAYNKIPAFVWFRHINEYDDTIQKYYYSIKCFSISRLLNIDCICDKYQLYINMQKYFPDTYLQFMPKSFKLENETQFTANGVFIARPINELETKFRCHSGNGICVYDSEPTLIDVKETMLNKYDTIIVSEYITNPLLFKKKKMHLRCYMYVTIINNLYSGYVYDDHKIYTASNEYVSRDFQNKNIHDSHGHNVSCFIDGFSENFTSENVGHVMNENVIEKIHNDIREIGKKMAIIFKDKAKCPPNAKNAFHLFGFDILIDENFKVYLLECNRFCQMTNIRSNVDFYDQFFNWVNDVILTPLFHNDNKINASMMNTPVYSCQL
jgi:hypothetical protein